MKSFLFRLVLLAGLCASVALTQTQESATPAFPQRIDPAFRGFWTLNVEKSDFAGRPNPKLGQVNWGEHGWTFAIVTANGRLYADGVVTDRGCAFIGVSPNYSCEVEVVTPRHVRFTLRQGVTVLRVGDIELLEDGTTQTIHRVTPSQGPPYVEKTIWERPGREQSKSSSSARAEAEVRAAPAESLRALLEGVTVGFTKLETELYEAIKQKNALRLDQLLAPDYVLITSARAGDRMDRKSWLDLIHVYNVESFTIGDVVVRCLAPRTDSGETCDLAVVSLTTTQIAKVGGEDRSGPGFLVDVWARRNGSWQLFSRYAGPRGTSLPKVMQPHPSPK